MSYASPLIKNDYEQWVYNFLTVLSEPMYSHVNDFDMDVFQEAYQRRLYTFPAPDHGDIFEDGCSNFIKGVQSMYEIDNYLLGCKWATTILSSHRARKNPLDLWIQMPCNKMDGPTHLDTVEQEKYPDGSSYYDDYEDEMEEMDEREAQGKKWQKVYEEIICDGYLMLNCPRPT